MQSHSLRMNQAWIVPLIALLAFIGGCTPKPASLVWEKVAEDWGAATNFMYKDPSPKMLVVGNKQDIVTVQNGVIPSHLQLITNTDLAIYLVVVVYQGQKGQTEYSIQVTNVQQEDKAIKVYAQFHGPGPGTPAGQLVTSPYYILKIHRTEAMKGDMDFILIADDKEVFREKYNIP